MSCIRFNTPAQRQAMRDYRPTMLVGDTSYDTNHDGALAPGHPVPAVTESKIRRIRLLAENANPRIRESAASSLNTPVDVFEALAADPEESVRAFVARNETTPCTVLRRLAADDSERVRGFVALNFFVPDETMHALAQDSSEVVRGLVAWKMSLADA